MWFIPQVAVQNVQPYCSGSSQLLDYLGEIPPAVVDYRGAGTEYLQYGHLRWCESPQ